VSRKKNVSVRVCVLNIDTTWKNIGVHECTLNLSLGGVHTHDNDTCGVHSVGRAQRIFVGAHTMWVYVVVRQV
jgi:hypothetical protein